MIKKHPKWEPYVFEGLELMIDKAVEANNEYARYRKWLIQKEKEFVESQQKAMGTFTKKKEEAKTTKQPTMEKVYSSTE